MSIRVLVTDGMDAGAVEKLRSEGYEIVEQFYDCLLYTSRCV